MEQKDMLTRSADEVLRAVERHRGLLRTVQESGALPRDACIILDCPHRRKLKETLREAVEVLEQTRKAFKSKQLEVLRKRLLGVLAEDA